MRLSNSTVDMHNLPVGSDINSSMDNAHRLTRFSVGISTLRTVKMKLKKFFIITFL